jgi:Fe-S-cluster containining protein
MMISRMSRPLTPVRRQALLDGVRTIYTELASRPVERDCIGRAECCRFKLTGRTPFLTRGEALVAAQAVRASGRKKLAPSPDGACPLLEGGRCRVYEGRPFGCRTHFCKAAGGPYARGEVRDLIQQLDDIDRELGGNGGVNLPGAMEWALKQTV